MKHVYFLSVAVIVSVGVFSGCSSAQQSTTGNTKSTPPTTKSGAKSYDAVITSEAKSDSGMFIVHRINEKVYYEIPAKELNVEMLHVSRVAKTPQIGYGGEEANTLVVRWEKKFSSIMLRTVSYVNVANDSLPIARSVKGANFEEVIMSFPIQAYGKDSASYVIDATDLYASDVPALGLDGGTREQYRVTRMDKDRSYIDYARSFPDNIEVENILTYNAEKPPQNASTKTISVTMHHSMVRLPKDKMMPRLADPRVGYFSMEQVDYGLPTQRAEQRSYILRWRLEPSDSAAFARGELVEPKKPITYYIDPATPVKWRNALKRGVEMWNVAFREAGFKNAIRALDPPTPEEDSTWTPEDARYSVIRYFPSSIENAYGPNIHDPRTGEILESDIGWYHNVMNLLMNWYFVQAVADPRSHKIPLPDSLMEELITFVAAHEVGHTLGLPHNMKASSSYPVDSLRSASFTRQYGTAPSIMDYARFNYVAQPGDGVALMPNIGPYDKFSIRWGYRPIPQASTPDAEKPVLNQWARAQDTNSMLMFGQQQWRIVDPSAQTEDLGDDPVKATTYGVKNIERLMGYLLDAAYKQGDDYSLLEELYTEALNQWAREMGHVANVPGGVIGVQKVYGQDGAIYTPVSKVRQKEAVHFLGDYAFKTPTMFLRDDILSKLEPSGSVPRLMEYQERILRTMISNDKLLRMNEQYARYSDSAYSPLELYNDVRDMLFSEVKEGKIVIDPYRRALQRAYIDELGNKLAKEKPLPATAGFFARAFRQPDVTNTDIRAITRGHLADLRTTLQNAAKRVSDDITRLHLNDLALTIETILDPRAEKGN